MTDIKLFIACHQPASLPDISLIHPIQVGSALTSARFEGYIYDDTGENISLKNRSYCELTAQYWAWKNDTSDYCGFFHYRRFLYPSLSARLPYCVKKAPDKDVLQKLGYSRFASLIESHDIIAPLAENMRISVREHYSSAPFHHAKDLQLIESIILETTPEYAPAMETYLSGSLCYFGNIYIMKRPLFHAYCAWLFPLLEEFDRRADLSGYGTQELRVDGFLAERLFGIWLTHVRSGLNVLELPRVHFEPNASARRQKLLRNALLPPGSLRRAWVKRLRSCL